LPSKKPTKKPAAKPRAKAAKPAKAAGSGQDANLVCAECSDEFTTKIALNNFEKEVGRKFSCPKCGAVYELISLLEGRITVTILAKGETRTYGKTYDLTTKGYARPL
jgi:DNA-directed RNA polymerase subunit RPC12/RpoP